MTENEATADSRGRQPQGRTAPLRTGTGPDRESALPLRLGLTALQAGPLLILVIFGAVFATWAPYFLSGRNLSNLAVQTSLIAALSMGQLLVIVTAGIDLSVGSVVALSTVTGAIAFHQFNAPAPIVILVILGTGAAVGLFNALVYVKGRVPHPFVVTLATMSVARGLALFITEGRPTSGMPTAIQFAGGGSIMGIPVPTLIVLGLAIVLFLFSTRLVWGQWIYAVGGNRSAARSVGIPVDRVVMSVYIISGFCAGVTALITAGRTNSGFPTAGNLAEMDAIAAVIIGGASFWGGRGSIINAVIGAVIIGMVRNGLDLMGVNSFAQMMVIGTAVFIAVEIDMLRAHLESRLRSFEARRRGV